MTNLTAALTSIRARLDAATPGPWDHGSSIDGRRGSVIVANDSNKVICQFGPDDIALSGIGKLAHIKNYRLIASAPEDLRQLCDALEVLLEANEFYADSSSWMLNSDRNAITEIVGDQNNDNERLAGTKAREARAKVEAIFGKEGV